MEEEWTLRILHSFLDFHLSHSRNSATTLLMSPKGTGHGRITSSSYRVFSVLSLPWPLQTRLGQVSRTSNPAGHLGTQCLPLNIDHETQFVQPRSSLTSALSAPDVTQLPDQRSYRLCCWEPECCSPTRLQLFVCTLQLRRVVLGMVPRKFLLPWNGLGQGLHQGRSRSILSCGIPLQSVIALLEILEKLEEYLLLKAWPEHTPIGKDSAVNPAPQSYI